jgi:glycosyltransferase involved in cell wall biosynthesis
MKSKEPLVSINIPTLNSEKTLARTLDSIKQQTYTNYEVLIIDNGSNDKTVEISKKYTNKIFVNHGKLLGSRYIGVKESKGKIVMLLDSDQVLDRTAIERGVKLIQNNGYDMVFLEEDSYKPETIIEKLSSLDRRTTHQKRVTDPSLSVLLPRMFKREILVKAFSKIDPRLFNVVTLQDHAIIYYESYKISKKVGYLEKAVYHEEPKTISELFKHYFSWGIKVGEKSKDLPDEYKNMFASKINNRNKSINIFSINFPLILPVLIIKAFGYYSGLAYSNFK